MPRFSSRGVSVDDLGGYYRQSRWPMRLSDVRRKKGRWVNGSRGYALGVCGESCYRITSLRRPQPNSAFCEERRLPTAKEVCLYGSIILLVADTRFPGDPVVIGYTIHADYRSLIIQLLFIAQYLTTGLSYEWGQVTSGIRFTQSLSFQSYKGSCPTPLPQVCVKLPVTSLGTSALLRKKRFIMKEQQQTQTELPISRYHRTLAAHCNLPLRVIRACGMLRFPKPCFELGLTLLKIASPLRWPGLIATTRRGTLGTVVGACALRLAGLIENRLM
ncbi:hypothetical protein BO82DRAFT_366056 [Aspergillus uvarum CBS 121591]|uniref:Uncharacterized protein n=1 Tax=Aspergillus uvarum CBS 121591 TaxID=1448315 RepID=A0A319C993_9EURO|nr:hypothetical protein BO82DRAFT_366056 [Aspergillus uvarum CBS 121591]PYH80267.1 hypothetical protein BO82DRAFT_366056 [Aspergillus uvarum CBS 121591]